MNVLLIDNYDSFTYNLAHLIGHVTKTMPTIIKNDEWDYQQILSNQFSHIILSPGPGNPTKPTDFGVCSEVIHNFNGPLLGVCLGHQGIASTLLNDPTMITQAPEPYHGRTSEIYHNNDTIFEGLPSPFKAMRYHSLIVRDDVKKMFHIIAQTKDRLVMGIRHKTKPIIGIQFHPESFLSEAGERCMKNFLTKTNP